VDQEMSILKDLWEKCGGFVLSKFFLVLGNEHGVVSLKRLGGS